MKSDNSICRASYRFDSLIADIFIFISTLYSEGIFSQLSHCDAKGAIWGYYNHSHIEFYKRNVSHTKQIKKWNLFLKLILADKS